MPDNDLLYTPVWRLRQLLESREVSSLELTETYLRRIEQLNPKLNAYLTVTGDEARAAAQDADKRIQTGEASRLLLGIPISIKDLEATRGIRTTMGSLVFKDTVPDVDSVVAERVKASGAVLLGKTNTPEFGLQGTTENRLGEPCRNPWNTERTPGGPAEAPVPPWPQGCVPSPREPTAEGPFATLAACAVFLVSSRAWAGFHEPVAWAGPLPT